MYKLSESKMISSNLLMMDFDDKIEELCIHIMQKSSLDQLLTSINICINIMRLIFILP